MAKEKEFLDIIAFKENLEPLSLFELKNLLPTWLCKTSIILQSCFGCWVRCPTRLEGRVGFKVLIKAYRHLGLLKSTFLISILKLCYLSFLETSLVETLSPALALFVASLGIFELRIVIIPP